MKTRITLALSLLTVALAAAGCENGMFARHDSSYSTTTTTYTRSDMPRYQYEVYGMGAGEQARYTTSSR